METSSIIAVIGGIALLAGLFGGGIQLKELRIPSIPKGLRILSSLIGVVLICIAILLSYPNIKSPSVTQTSSTQNYDCITTVGSSRPLTPNGTGDDCWLKLSDGGPTKLTFNDSTQITYGTSTGGDDRYFFIAKKGDRLSDVTGATIRPMLHIKLKFGSLHALKINEINYHNDRATCLRDANDGNKPLNALCN